MRAQDQAVALLLFTLYLTTICSAADHRLDVGQLPELLNLDETDDGRDVPLPLQRLAEEIRTLKEDESSRARFLGITDGGTYRGELVVWIPLTLVLPTFGFRSRYSQAGSEFARSFDDSRDIRGPVDRVLSSTMSYRPDDPDYYFDADFGPLLSRMDAYFHFLKIHDDTCRQKLTCRMAQDLGRYSPLSDLVFKVLKSSEALARPATYHPALFRFYKYYWAAEKGQTAASCDQLYSACPAAAEEMVNPNIMEFWQELSNILPVKLTDE